MHPIVWESRPRLRHPILIAAFEGWGDAADAATTAAKFLSDAWSAKRFASVDPEDFYDFTVTRPEARVDPEFARRIEWPRNDFEWAHIPDLERDAVFFRGIEPQLKWRTYVNGIVEVAHALGIEFVLSLGSLLADVPHTRPVRVMGTAADPDVVIELGLRRSRYEGPTGVSSVVLDTMHRAGIKSASLWASAPYYLPRTPSPKAALALVERTVNVLGVGIDTSELQLRAQAYEREVNEMVASEEEVADYVRQLEDANEEVGDGDELREMQVPSGDAIAAEIERFLRENRSD